MIMLLCNCFSILIFILFVLKEAVVLCLKCIFCMPWYTLVFVMDFIHFKSWRFVQNLAGNRIRKLLITEFKQRFGIEIWYNTCYRWRRGKKKRINWALYYIRQNKIPWALFLELYYFYFQFLEDLIMYFHLILGASIQRFQRSKFLLRFGLNWIY